MHDLATIVRMNEKAYLQAVAESFVRFGRIESELRKRGFIGFVQPITVNGIVVAADWWDDTEKVRSRAIIRPDAFFSL